MENKEPALEWSKKPVVGKEQWVKHRYVGGKFGFKVVSVDKSYATGEMTTLGTGKAIGHKTDLYLNWCEFAPMAEEAVLAC